MDNAFKVWGPLCDISVAFVGCKLLPLITRSTENAFVCLSAHARKYSGAAKTHTAEQHGSPQRGSRGSSHNQGPAVACDLLLAS